ncbi:MAG: hypothetical protein U5L09_14825 [Bacteroidales bacterium]|nr:hypothetical protein [Bacteroidales bacterium]
MFVLILTGFPEGQSQGIDMTNEERIDELISEMTVREKAGQMTQITLETILRKRMDKH